MTSQAKLPFITLKMKPNEYHQLMPTLLDYAKTKGLYDYVVGNETVKTQDALNMQNQSKNLHLLYCPGSPDDRTGNSSCCYGAQKT